MPYRKIIFTNDYYYHVLNRGVSRSVIFQDTNNYLRALQTINYYRFELPALKFSRFTKLDQARQKEFLESLKQKQPLVDIISFCIMPNHIHFLLKQNVSRGIPLFMANWQNSYARYFNIKYKHKGYLFESSFKAKIIEKDRLLFHISRYIHLNPATASLITIDKLSDYHWSSYPEYLDKNAAFFANTDLILSHFKGRNSYKEFVLNQAAYQKKLHYIKKFLMD